MKKILISVLLVFAIISCQLKEAKNAYDNGDYLKSTEIAMNYLNKNSINKLKSEEKEELLSRFNVIANSYEGKIRVNNSQKYRYLFEYWQIIYLLNTNKLVQNEMYQRNVTAVSNEFQLLMNAIDAASMYVKSTDKMTINSVISSLKPVTEFIRYYKITNQSEYTVYIANYYRLLADLYNRIAELEEAQGNLEQAKSMYFNSYQIYKDYSLNYKNNFFNYERLDKEIINKNARELYNQAVNLSLKQNYKDSINKYKESKALYNKYPREFFVELNDIEQGLKYTKANYTKQQAEEFFQKGAKAVLNARSREDYKTAYKNFQKANNLIPNYKNTQELIQRYKKLYDSTKTNEIFTPSIQDYNFTKQEYVFEQNQNVKKDYEIVPKIPYEQVQVQVQKPTIKEPIKNSYEQQNVVDDRYINLLVEYNNPKKMEESRNIDSIKQSISNILRSNGISSYNYVYSEEVDVKTETGSYYQVNNGLQRNVVQSVTITPVITLNGTRRIEVEPVVVKNEYVEALTYSGVKVVKGREMSAQEIMYLNQQSINNNILGNIRYKFGV